ncbi:acyltransferase domain-containing protein [uncultured Dokdonia sp.]|uniref:acyltransferase domain-containing protein n=1 Tax=uncultured Dokdonia sp. TaxID=575653 RepID=UPI00263271BA|nr:acyltransferase domain-containing protein [uncultured Dokdonia sp.]
MSSNTQHITTTKHAVQAISYIGYRGQGIQDFWQQTLLPDFELENSIKKYTTQEVIDLAIQNIIVQSPTILRSSYDLIILIEENSTDQYIINIEKAIKNSNFNPQKVTVQRAKEADFIQELYTTPNTKTTIFASLYERQASNEAIFLLLNEQNSKSLGTITEVSNTLSIEEWNSEIGTAKYIDILQKDQSAPLYQKATSTNTLENFKHYYWSTSQSLLFESFLSISRSILASYSELLPASEIGVDDTVKHYKKVFPWFHSIPEIKRESISCLITSDSAYKITIQEASKKEQAHLFSLDKPQLLLFSAVNQPSLLHQLEETLLSLTNQEEDVYTLSRKLNQQHHQSYRLVFPATPLTIIKKLEEAITLLKEKTISGSHSKKGIVYGVHQTKPKIAFTYPGQGSQYTGMLQELSLHFSDVRSSISELDQALYGINALPNSMIVYPTEGAKTSEEKEMLQKELFNMEGGATNIVISSVALFDLLKKCGVSPEVHMGHSHGENTALNTSGILSNDRAAFFDLVTEISRRGSEGISEGEIPVGKFISVALFQQNIDAILEKYKEDIYIAMDNCPHQFVVFGKNETIDDFQKEISDVGAICISLPFDRAYHTPFFEREMRFIQPIYDSIDLYTPTAKVFSCIDLEYFPEDPIVIKSKLGRQWTNCVRFREAIEVLHQDGINRFIEVGPGSTLTGFTNDTLNGKDFKAFACDIKQKGALKQLQFILAKLFVDGVDITVAPFLKKESSVTSLPLPKKAIAAPQISNTPPSAQQHILKQHFELMNQFLQQQEQISKQVFGSHHISILSPQEEQPQPILPPLLDRITTSTPDEVVFEKTLTLATDLFLKDHTLGRFSDPDEILSPLPVMPFVTTMEIIAEAASHWATDTLFVTKLEDIRGHKWIALDQETLHLMITAKKEKTTTNSQKIKVCLYIDKVIPTNKVAEGTAILSREYKAAPKVQLPEMEIINYPTWDAKNFNETCLFHGPSFTSMDRLQSVGDTGIILDLKNPTQKRFVANNEDPNFKTPGAILDASGQMVAYWLVEQGETHFGTFPFYVASFELYAPPQLNENQKISCSAQFEKNNDIITGDYQFYSNDQVLFSIQGLHSKYYDFPTKFLNCLYWEGANSYLSTPISLQSDTPIQARRITDLPNGFLDQGGEVWLRALAHMMLSQKEKDTWYAFPEKGNRRKEWLLGRVVAKEVVRTYADQHYFLALSPRDIEITTSELGKPLVHCPALENVGTIPNISISHSLSTAIAAITPQEMLIGIDIELIHKKEEDYNVNLVFDAQEKTLLQGHSLLPYFCAKEAAAKSIGIPFLGSYTTWKITSFSEEAVTIQHENEFLEVAIYKTDTEIIAICTHTVEEQLLNN